MKKLLLVVFAFLISGLLNAQETTTKKRVKKDAAEQVAKKKTEKADKPIVNVLEDKSFAKCTHY